MMGQQNNFIPQTLYNEHNVRLRTDLKKALAYKNKLQRTHTITEEENYNFDAENEHRVLNYLRDRVEIMKPIFDEVRQDPNFKLSTLELRRLISSFKEKAPGTSGITRRALMEAPDQIIAAYMNIYNIDLQNRLLSRSL